MKTLLTCTLIFCFLAALSAGEISELQQQHREMLLLSKSPEFLAGSHILLKTKSCSGCSDAKEISTSLYIENNKFSLYAKQAEKYLHQKGIVSIFQNKVIFTVRTQVGKRGSQKAPLSFQFALNFEFLKPVHSSIRVAGNFDHVLPKAHLDAHLVYCAALVYDVIKANLQKQNFKACIMAFVRSEKRLISHLIEDHAKIIYSRGFGCPKCGYNGHYYRHYCKKCGSCFSASSLTCPSCYSQNWTNGKVCCRCGHCYK